MTPQQWKTIEKSLAASPVMLDQVLTHLIAEAERLVGTLPPLPPSPAADAWFEDVVEKYRRQGFTL